MPQKQYKFPRKNGSELTKTLAEPTHERIVAGLKAFGLKSFAEMYNDQLIAHTLLRLDLGIDLDKLKDVLDICLLEGHEGIEFEGLDLRITDRVVQDFFEQRSRTFSEARNN